MEDTTYLELSGRHIGNFVLEVTGNPDDGHLPNPEHTDPDVSLAGVADYDLYNSDATFVVYAVSNQSDQLMGGRFLPTTSKDRWELYRFPSGAPRLVVLRKTKFTVTATAGDFSMLVNGVLAEYTAAGGDTASDIVDGLLAEIADADITETDGGIFFTLETKNDKVFFSVTEITYPVGGNIVVAELNTAKVYGTLTAKKLARGGP